MVKAVKTSLILNCDSHPDIVRPVELAGQFRQSFRPLRQHLKNMVFAFVHNGKNVLYER